MRRAVFAAVAACFLWNGCVKEERSACPCYLTFNLDRVIGEGGFDEAVATLGPCSDRALEQERIALWEYEGTGYEKKVLKDVVRASMVCGFKNGIFRNDCYLVPKSLQSDPIMAYALSMRCMGEREEVNVELHKQYCRIHFSFAGVEARAEFPYELRVRADCNGFNLYDLSPVEGEYTAMALETNSGDLSVVLPRQKSNELALDLLDFKAELAYVVDLGSMLEKRGYDWTKTDLDDVEVEIDYAMTEFIVEIIPWERKYEKIDI